MQKLVKGEVVVHSITFKEGLTTSEMITLIQAQEGLVGDLPKATHEGVLLPETYHYTYGDLRSDLLFLSPRAQTLNFVEPGQPLRPLAKVASGGELSRLSLAVQVACSTQDARCRVFDEVDSGVG